MNKEQIIDKFLVRDIGGYNYKFPIECGAVYDKKYLDSLDEKEFKTVILHQLRKTQMYAIAQFNEMIDEIEND